jgi:restriction system protein
MESLQSLLDMFLTLFQLLLVFWPVWVVLGIVGAISIAFKLVGAYRLSKAGMADIDKMNGKEFEQYLAVLFDKLGYQVKRTSYRGDYGADLVIQKLDEKIVVQAKRYNKKVGIKAVQEAVASKDYYRCRKAMVVTNSQYTQQAINLAQANNVELWDRKKLVKMMLAVKRDGVADVTTSGSATAIDPVPIQDGSSSASSDQMICQICHNPVSQNVKAYCLAHQDIFRGNIYCFDHQKTIRRHQGLGSKS